MSNDIKVDEFLNNASVPANLNEFLEHSGEVPNDGRVFCETLYVAGSVNVGTVNTIDFDDLLKGVYLTNMNHEFTEPLIINGVRMI